MIWEKRKRRHKLLISGMKWDITTDLTDSKSVTRKYSEHLCTLTFDNLVKKSNPKKSLRLFHLCKFFAKIDFWKWRID